MSAIYPTLPFPRGSTYSDGGILTMSDTYAQDLEGKCYLVEDELHGPGSDVVLRVVKNDSSAAITVAKKFFGWSSTTENDFGRRVSGLASDNTCSKPMDDYYIGKLTTIPDDDLFYVVDEGNVDVLITSGSGTVSAGNQITTAANGMGQKTADGDFALGIATEAGATATTTARCVWISGGVAKTKAGGA